MTSAPPLFDLTGRVAVVTGAARGLGRAFAIGLAEHGAAVAVLDLDDEAGRDAASEVASLGVQSLYLCVDVSDKEQVDAAFSRVADDFGRLDVAVNNAGVWSHVPALDLTVDEWDKVVAVNLTGTLLCCQAAGRIMISQGRGSIINITSISGVLGNKQRTAYAATKHGVIGLTKSLANEWATTGVRVNAIGPGAHDTDMTKAAWDTPEERYERQIRKIPMGRLGEPKELVGPLVFLASDAAPYVTGQTIFSDGGWLLE